MEASGFAGGDSLVETAEVVGHSSNAAPSPLRPGLGNLATEVRDALRLEFSLRDVELYRFELIDK